MLFRVVLGLRSKLQVVPCCFQFEIENWVRLSLWEGVRLADSKSLVASREAHLTLRILHFVFKATRYLTQYFLKCSRDVHDPCSATASLGNCLPAWPPTSKRAETCDQNCTAWRHRHRRQSYHLHQRTPTVASSFVEACLGAGVCCGLCGEW